MSILRFLSGGSKVAPKPWEGLTPEDSVHILANMLHRTIQRCDQCKESFSSDHRFVQLASVVVQPQAPNPTTLMNATTVHDWQLLSSLKAWDGTGDNLVSYVITCPKGGGVMAHIYDPVELYENQSLYRKELLGPEDMQAISKVIPETEWKAF